MPTMASEVPMPSRIGMCISPTSTGTSRTAPPAPTSPAMSPIAPGRPTAAGRLNGTAAGSRSLGGAAGVSSISGSAAGVIRATVAGSARRETRAAEAEAGGGRARRPAPPHRGPAGPGQPVVDERVAAVAPGADDRGGEHLGHAEPGHFLDRQLAGSQQRRDVV